MKTKNRWNFGGAHILRALYAVFALVLAVSGAIAQAGTSSGLDGKLIVGYQGWFGCPGDSRRVLCTECGSFPMPIK